MTMTSCPGEATLRFLGTDALGDATYAAIESHVEGCPECKAVLERLAHRRPNATLAAPGPEGWPHIPGFEIQSRLGRGAMGVVYLAMETGLDRLVALKILPGALGPDASAGPRRRWLREARAVSRIRHPDVVPLYDYGEADGCFFLVLEYIPGGTLKQRLADPLPPRVAAGLMETIARAVGHLHGCGLLHLDLKPSNILLDCKDDDPWERVTPRISDFSLARSHGDFDASEISLAGLRGTPSYMAPEQTTASRAGIGAAADIHALGAILYELLTGRPPFQGTSTLETLDQVRGQNPVSPRRLNPKIPRDLETIALKCLEKHPSRRYAAAEAMADDLDRFLEGRPLEARPVSPVEHAWRWCRRQPVVAALTATLLLTVLGGLLGLFALWRRSEAMRLRSEAMRLRSEANYQVAARSLDEIVRIMSDSRIYVSSIHSGQELEKTLELARSQGIELSKRSTPDASDLKRLATIDGYLAAVYFGDGKPDEGKSLMEESISYCEAYLARNPDDVQIQSRLFSDVNWMAMAYHSDSKNDQLYQQWHARAIATLGRLKSPPDVHVWGMFEVSRWQRRYANRLMLAGDSERARKEFEKDLDFLRSAPDAETAFPGFVLSEALTLAALGQWHGEFKRPVSGAYQQQANGPIPDLEWNLAELAARRIGWLPSIVRPHWLIPEDRSNEAWVDRVIVLIKTDAATFHLDHTQIPAIVWQMWIPYVDTLARQRQVDKLSETLRIADRLVALAERLRRSYPGQAAPYMLLSEGYLQRAKYAYRVDGEPVIGWERKSLEAAGEAATRDPENAVARNLVKNRLVRLSKLAAK